MPTIEIVSLERTAPLKIPKGKYPFRIWQNKNISSHRWLFQEFLNDKTGIILHLANLECEKTGFWFASSLIDHDFEGYCEFEHQNDRRFKFGSSYFSGIEDLLLRACKLSPIKSCYFLTDNQFGEVPKNSFEVLKLEEFWLLHDKSGLTWNTLYELLL